MGFNLSKVLVVFLFGFSAAYVQAEESDSSDSDSFSPGQLVYDSSSNRYGEITGSLYFSRSQVLFGFENAGGTGFPGPARFRAVSEAVKTAHLSHLYKKGDQVHTVTGLEGKVMAVYPDGRAILEASIEGKNRTFGVDACDLVVHVGKISGLSVGQSVFDRNGNAGTVIGFRACEKGNTSYPSYHYVYAYYGWSALVEYPEHKFGLVYTSLLVGQ